MDFLRNHAHLAGGDTRKAPKYTQFSKSRHTPRGQGSPPRQPLPIHQITGNPLNPFYSILSNRVTRKAPKKVVKTRNLANHGIRQEGKVPPHAITHKPTYHSQTLSILSNQNTHAWDTLHFACHAAMTRKTRCW
jgi:hypothetical protein